MIIRLLLVMAFWVGTVAGAATLPDTVAGIKPSIVAVGTFHPTRAPRSLFLGTGFVIGQGDLIVTNAHVLPHRLDTDHKERPAVFIRREGKNQMLAVNVLARAEDVDLAVLKLADGKRLPALALGHAKSVREGELYAFTGYPIGMVLGLYPVTHRGIVSAITPMAIPAFNSRQLDAKLIKRLRDNPTLVFQLDATAYPGNSGSPLYHPESGKVVGIINKVFVKDSKENALSEPSGISYAIPVDHLRRLLARLSKN